MQATETKARKLKVIGILKDINISKDDLLEYLKSINVEATINTTLELDVAEKVYNHFRKDIEKEDKRLKKSVDFVERYHVDISEAQEKIKQEEDRKNKIEEEKRLKKLIEDDNKRKEEEKKKQELLAYMQREKTIKEQKEKEKEKKTAKKETEEKAKAKIEKPSDEKPKVARKKEFPPSKKFIKKDEKSPGDISPEKQTPDTGEKKGTVTPQKETGRPVDSDKRRTFDKNTRKGTYEKISIKDLKSDKKRQKPSLDKPKDGAKGDKKFTQSQVPGRTIEDRRFTLKRIRIKRNMKPNRKEEEE